MVEQMHLELTDKLAQRSSFLGRHDGTAGNGISFEHIFLFVSDFLNFLPLHSAFPLLTLGY